MIHKDTIRLNWLEENPESGEPQIILHPPSGDITWRCHSTDKEYKTLRKAIDAAMKSYYLKKSEFDFLNRVSVGQPLVEDLIHYKERKEFYRLFKKMVDSYPLNQVEGYDDL